MPSFSQRAAQVQDEVAAPACFVSGEEGQRDDSAQEDQRQIRAGDPARPNPEPQQGPDGEGRRRLLIDRRGEVEASVGLRASNPRVHGAILLFPRGRHKLADRGCGPGPEMT